MRIRIPATTANMGAGFDTFGMALGYYNYISIEEAEEQQCFAIGEGASDFSTRKDNLILRSIRQVYQEVDKPIPFFKLTMENNIPISRGMGSSAAAIVGGVYSANALLGYPLTTEKVLDIATSIEGHPDNVAPALLGGFVVSSVNQKKSVQTIKLTPPQELKMIVCIPDFKLATKKAREALPRNIAFCDAVFNISNASMLVGAMATGNIDLLGKSLNDKLHQPYRFNLIPGSEKAIQAANRSGAIGAAISGSGPSMIAFAITNAAEIGRAMVNAFASEGLSSRYIVVDADNIGTQIMQEE